MAQCFFSTDRQKLTLTDFGSHPTASASNLQVHRSPWSPLLWKVIALKMNEAPFNHLARFVVETVDQLEPSVLAGADTIGVARPNTQRR